MKCTRFMKRKIEIIGLILTIACLAAGCNKEDDTQNKKNQNNVSTESSEAQEDIKDDPELVTLSDKKVVKVDFYRDTTEKNGVTYERAVVVGYDENVEKVWVHCGKYTEAGEYSTCCNIGESSSGYLFTEGNLVICIDAQTGNIVWRNSDLKGSEISVGLDYSGNYWLCGYAGNELLIIDQNGNTLANIEKIVESDDYYWPKIMGIEDDRILIEYFSVSRSNPEKGRIVVDMETYDYSFK